MSMSYIGPVAVELLDPSFDWDGTPEPGGFRPARLSGLIEWAQVHQLIELTENAGRRVTIGRYTGVLEYIHTADELLGPFRGWYLLESFQTSPGVGHSAEGIAGLAPFSLQAVRVSEREPVVARSSRTRANDFAITGSSALAEPFEGEFLTDPGGSRITRAYDPGPHALEATGSEDLGVWVGASASVVPLALDDASGVPGWVSNRGMDVRAYDRREEREVFGPSHPFQAATDLVLTNGHLRFWVGPRGVAPHVNVEVFADDEWQPVGTLSLDDLTATLASARLVRVTPDVGVVSLGVVDRGEVTLTLRRGERGIAVGHGGSRLPLLTAPRYARWRGLPPTAYLDASALAAGKFGQGLDVTAGGVAKFPWPPPVAASAWSFAFWWLPDDASTALADAGLLSLVDEDGAQVGAVRFVDSTNVIRFTLGAATLNSAAITFAADEPVFVSVAFSTTEGMSLTVDGVTVSDAAALTPVDAAHFYLGAVSDGSTAGGGTAGSGFAGGVWPAHGVLDNAMMFEDRLSDAECEALSAAASPFDGLPSPEARLVMHLPFEARLVTNGSAMATGRRYEATAEAGSTRNPDAEDLTKALAVLDDDVISVAGLAVGQFADSLEVYVSLATTDTGDDLADHHEQFAAASEQEVRVR